MQHFGVTKDSRMISVGFSEGGGKFTLIFPFFVRLLMSFTSTLSALVQEISIESLHSALSHPSN